MIDYWQTIVCFKKMLNQLIWQRLKTKDALLKTKDGLVKTEDGLLRTEDVLLKTKDGPSANRKLLTYILTNTDKPTHPHTDSQLG